MKSQRLLLVAACCAVLLGIALYFRGGAPPPAIAAAPVDDAARGRHEVSRDVPEVPATERKLAPLVVEAPNDAPALWSELGEPGALTGLVSTASAEPIPGALCTLWAGTPSSGFGRELDSSTGVQHQSDANGRFHIPVENGSWSLEVSAEGFGTERVDHLRAGDHRVVVLEPSVQLVVEVRGEGGAPLEAVEVSLLDDFRRIQSRPIDRSTTDASGVAVFERVAPGDAYVMLRRADYQHQLEIVAIPPTTRWHEVVLDMVPGVRLTGRVVAQSDGAPVPGANVRIEAFGKGQSLLVEFVADAEGRFSTEHLYAQEEPVVVTASAPGRAEATRMVIVRPESVAREREIELALASDERRIRGRAVDEGGRPLAGVSVAYLAAPPMGRGREALAMALAQVTPYAERWRRAGTTDASGTFEVARAAPNLEYVLHLSSEGRSPGVRWVSTAAESEAIEVGDIALEPAGSIFGYVAFEEDGEPVVGELVRAQLEIILSESEFGSEFDSYRPKAWWRPLGAVTAGDGSFRIDDVAPGNYDVKLGALGAGQVLVTAGHAVGPVRILAPRELFDDELDMRLVRGVVLGEAGEAVGQGFVALFRVAEAEDAAARPVSMTMTDFRGRFQMRAPLGDPHVLRVTSVLGGYHAHESRLPVFDGAGEPFQVEVRMLQDLELREPLLGLVLDPTGRPLEGISVSIQPPENEYCGCLSFETKTNAEGLVSFKGLADEDYTVIARDPLGRYAPRTFPAQRPGGYFEVVFE